MNRYSLTHLSDEDLLRQLKALAAQDRANTAALLAHIGEADARRLDPAVDDELLDDAAHRYRPDTEQPNAEGSPQPEPQARMEANSPPSSPAPQTELSPGTVEASAEEQASSGAAGQLSPGTVEAPARRPELTQIAPGLYLLDVTLDRDTYEKLLYAQALLGDEIPSAGFADVIDHAFRALIEALEE